jgi:hypothetical protein
MLEGKNPAKREVLCQLKLLPMFFLSPAFNDTVSGRPATSRMGYDSPVSIMNLQL